MGACNYMAVMLPDIEIYGGDTQPWAIPVVHKNGTPYTVNEIKDYGWSLSISPFAMRSAFSTGVTPLIIKDGIAGADEDGGAIVIFEFNKADTLTMNGKFIYQIEAALNENKSRVAQGKLIIHPNVNRGD